MTKTFTFIGIDPGFNGSIVAISDTETKYIALSKATEREIALFIKNIQGDKFAGIELVHSFPKQGVVSTFKFGRSYGLLRGILIATDTPFIEVSPVKWQKAFNIVKSDTRAEHKRQLKQKAQQLFPNINITNEIADGFLIAYYLKNCH